MACARGHESQDPHETEREACELHCGKPHPDKEDGFDHASTSRTGDAGAARLGTTYSPRAPGQRTEELRTSNHRALDAWLEEFAHLEIAGFRSHVTKEVERRDLGFLRAGEPAGSELFIHTKQRTWAFALTAHYLRAQETPAAELPIHAILTADRVDDVDATRWLWCAERLLSDLVKASETTLFELWFAQSIYCAAQRDLVDARAPNSSHAYDRSSPSSHLQVLRDAAEAEDPRAAYALGLAEINGIGTRKRPGTGVRWLERAASLGHAEAQYELGTIYTHGWSVPRDEVVGLAWFMTAQRTGHDQARQRVETIATATGMTAAQVAGAEQLSRTLNGSPRRPPGA